MVITEDACSDKWVSEGDGVDGVERQSSRDGMGVPGSASPIGGMGTGLILVSC